MSTKHIVYILKCKDNTYYTGYTNNVTNRLKMHESGKGAKYTRGRGPFILIYQEPFPTKEKAMQVEYRIKKLSRTRKEQLIKLKKWSDQFE
ncbi:putative endonuclease [Amphibacillus marinus]|uniref:Putative endonuclease n=1 Tax=Amphibacillus marinus TaxID=872970 RepID=A0A1H8PBC1_9BACI|nr:GIY-YIG nuclease family protein [Amphibacillus marinus]SEO38833.1 putative endonuclease [Amphibacillus marinus]